MSWFVLVEMTLVGVMAFYLAYHVRNIFTRVKYQNVITAAIIIGFIVLSLDDLIYFGFLVNACICLVIFDVIRFILYITKFNQYIKFSYRYGIIIVLVISLILSFYGMYNAKNTVITTYDIEINKNFNDKTLMIVSDIHLGTIVSKTDLTKISNHANAIDPEGIILLGDIFDENTTSDEVTYAMKIFESLAAKYPVYFIEGNHEIGFKGRTPLKEFDIVNRLQESGVIVLLDEAVSLDDIYLIGRKDYVVKNRKELEEITNNLDDNKPLILLDHQPRDYKHNAELGIDLQLSGHTHAGQIFPLNYFYELIKVNEMNYGIKKDGDFCAVVTSGMGGWGYNMRTANHSEIVVVNLKSRR